MHDENQVELFIYHSKDTLQATNGCQKGDDLKKK